MCDPETYSAVGDKENVMSREVMIENEHKLGDFCHYLYFHIFSKYTFVTPGLKEKFEEEFALWFSNEDESKVIHFTENIGKAVWSTQFLLREYFWKSFDFTFCREDFMDDAKILWNNWLDSRRGISLWTIETLAIVAEAILYCDSHMDNFKIGFEEVIDFFMDWFSPTMKEVFFYHDAFKRLDIYCLKVYDDFARYFESQINNYNLKYEIITYDEGLIALLESSFIEFPVLENTLLGFPNLHKNKDRYRRMVYLRLEEEMVNTNESAKPGFAEGRLHKKLDGRPLYPSTLPPIARGLSTVRPTLSPIVRGVSTVRSTSSPIGRGVSTVRSTLPPIVRGVSTIRPTLTPIVKGVSTVRPAFSPIVRDLSSARSTLQPFVKGMPSFPRPTLLPIVRGTPAFPPKARGISSVRSTLSQNVRGVSSARPTLPSNIMDMSSVGPTLQVLKKDPSKPTSQRWFIKDPGTELPRQENTFKKIRPPRRRILVCSQVTRRFPREETRTYERYETVFRESVMSKTSSISDMKVDETDTDDVLAGLRYLLPEDLAHTQKTPHTRHIETDTYNKINEHISIFQENTRQTSSTDGTKEIERVYGGHRTVRAIPIPKKTLKSLTSIVKKQCTAPNRQNADIKFHLISEKNSNSMGNLLEDFYGENEEIKCKSHNENIDVNFFVFKKDPQSAETLSFQPKAESTDYSHSHTLNLQFYEYPCYFFDQQKSKPRSKNKKHRTRKRK